MKPPTPSTTLEDYHRQIIQSCPFIDGKELTITAAATTSTQQVHHGLGRAYRGAWLISGPAASLIPRFLDPATQDDPSKYLYFALASATAGAFRVWIY
jgi:hypothetical protein